MSTTFLIIAMIAIAVFIVGFAVVARMFIGRLKGEDEEIVRAREEGREPAEDNIPRR